MGQIVACETTAVVAERQTDNQTHADDSDDETGSADEEAVLVAIAEQSTGDKSNDFDGASRCGV